MNDPGNPERDVIAFRVMSSRLLLKRALSLSTGVIAGLVLTEGMLRLSGVVREVGPALTRYDPVYGKRLRENLQATRTTPEFEIHYSINSMGFRGPEPPGLPEHPILFLGDSFTEGYGVSDGEEFPELVRRALVAKHGPLAPPVVNAGIGNTGNGHWVKLLRLEGHRFAPRLVVLQFTGNDFDDNLREQMYALDTRRQLVELPIPQPGAVHRINEFVGFVPGLSRTYLIGFAYQLYHKYTIWRSARARSSGGSEAAQDELTYRLWEETLRICAESRWPVVGIVVEMADRHVEQLRHMLDTRRASLIIVPTARQRPDLYYSFDGHWMSTGHAYVAQVLQNEVDRILLRTTEGN